MRDKIWKRRIHRNKLLEKQGNAYLVANKDEILNVYDRFAGYTDGFIDAMKYFKIWKKRI